ncbi:sugar kinase [Propionibacteriaceae bacterium Y1685]
MPAAPEVICLGETMIMITPHPVAPLVEATNCTLQPGGAESNVAMHLAALGHQALWSSRLGDDPLGDRVLARIADHGVDVSGVVRDPQRPTGVYFKDPAAGGTQVFYYRAGSAASAMDPGHLDALDLDRVKVVHISGITSGLSDSCASMINSLLERMGDLPGLVSFDVNHRPGVWPADTAAPVLRDLARRCDVVYVGLDEAERLWGCRTPEDVRTVLPEPMLVVKDGPVAAIEFSGEQATSVPSPVVEVVEPVGAGDAFAAGHLSGLLDGSGPKQRLALGHALAGIVLRSVSDVGEVAQIAPHRVPPQTEA